MDGVQIRLMGEDPESVRRVAKLLAAALGERLLVTGSAPTRRGPGLRVYGAVHPGPALPVLATPSGRRRI